MKRFVHVAAMVGALAAAPAAGEELVVDLSGSVVAITTGFVGSDLLLFGATEGAGDIVVVVRGTQGDERVRRKGKVAGIWINRDEMIFNGVPGFYSVAASRPLDDILIAAEQFDNQIGSANLRLTARDPARARIEVEAFREVPGAVRLRAPELRPRAHDLLQALQEPLTRLRDLRAQRLLLGREVRR